MPALSVSPPFPIFTDTDGQPLENGYVWIGTVNLNPINNPIAVFWDAALTQPAGQPIRTLNGYPSNAGTPTRLYANSDYSIQVQNKNGSVVYAAPAAGERFSGVVVDSDGESSTGTGLLVRAVSPSLVTPALGTPSSGNFSTGTFTWPTFNQNTTGTASNVTGTVAVANGGTGQTSYTNGQLLIGNTTGNTLAKATLTAGTGISITNGAGSITIAATAGITGGQAFTSNGTFTIPAGVTSLKATIVGGGGGGGGAAANATGGNGGGGCFAVVYLASLTPGNTISVTVGAAGTAGTSAPGNGGSGGNSQIASGTQSITTVTAGGGGGGGGGDPAGTIGSGGAGGTATNATWSVPGQSGQLLASTSRAGGSTLGHSSNVNIAGVGYGSGGGGGFSPSVNIAGAAGAAGFVLFEW